MLAHHPRTRPAEWWQKPGQAAQVAERVRIIAQSRCSASSSTKWSRLVVGHAVSRAPWEPVQLSFLRRKAISRLFKITSRRPSAPPRRLSTSDFARRTDDADGIPKHGETMATPAHSRGTGAAGQDFRVTRTIEIPIGWPCRCRAGTLVDRSVRPSRARTAATPGVARSQDGDRGVTGMR
jgi:hypothetical protein